MYKCIYVRKGLEEDPDTEEVGDLVLSDAEIGLGFRAFAEGGIVWRISVIDRVVN